MKQTDTRSTGIEVPVHIIVAQRDSLIDQLAGAYEELRRLELRVEQLEDVLEDILRVSTEWTDDEDMAYEYSYQMPVDALEHIEYAARGALKNETN